MMDPRDDKAFDDYLDGDSPVSRRYAQIESEEPPAGLDAEILEAARRATAPNVLPLRQPPRRWMMPITVAATVVLSFSLVMSMIFEMPELVEPLPLPTTVTDTDELVVTTRKSTARKTGKRTDAPATAPPVARRLNAPASAEDDAARARIAQELPAEKKEFREQAPAAPATSFQAGSGRVADGVASSAQGKMAADARGTPGLLAALKNSVRQDSQARAESEAESFALDQMVVTTRPTNPDDELAEIMALLEDGDDETALEMLDEFQAAWPDHPASRVYKEWLEQ